MVRGLIAAALIAVPTASAPTVELPVVPVLYRSTAGSAGDRLIWRQLPVAPGTVFCVAKLQHRKWKPVSMQCVRPLKGRAEYRRYSLELEDIRA